MPDANKKILCEAYTDDTKSVSCGNQASHVTSFGVSICDEHLAIEDEKHRKKLNEYEDKKREEAENEFRDIRNAYFKEIAEISNRNEMINFGFPEFNKDVILFKHQKETLDKYITNNRFCDFSEVGAGKTYPAILAIKYRIEHNNVNRALIIAPVSVMRKWKEELLYLGGIESEILYGTIHKRIKKLLSLNSKVCIINYRGIEVIKKYLSRHEFPLPKFDLILLDESHSIKNPSTTQSKNIIALGDKARYRYILTATNIANTALDIFNQLKFIDYSILGRSFKRFRDKYFNSIQIGRYRKYSLDESKIPELQKIISNHSVRHIKKDCTDMPQIMFERRDIEMTKEQVELYEKILKEIIIFFSTRHNDSLTANNILTRLLRLQQVSSGFVKRDDGTFFELKNNSKLNHLKNLITNELSDKKLVIFAHFKWDINTINNELKKDGFKTDTITGDVKEEDRYRIVNDFQNTDNIQIIVCQPRAGGIGINLDNASYSIRYSRSHSLLDYVQSLGRLERITTKIPITHIDLVSLNSYDEVIFNALSRKEDMLHKINQDNDFNKFLKRISIKELAAKDQLF